MKAKGTPIKGFSLYTTDGTGVFLRARLLRADGDVYKLIPDGGDGVNLAEISVSDALAGGKSGTSGVKRRPSGKRTTPKR